MRKNITASDHFLLLVYFLIPIVSKPLIHLIDWPLITYCPPNRDHAETQKSKCSDTGLSLSLEPGCFVPLPFHLCGLTLSAQG